MLALILAVSSLSAVNCEEIVQVYLEYQEVTGASDEDVRRFAGRCADYLDRIEDAEEEDK